MNEQEVLDLLEKAFEVGLLISLPVMISTLVVGVIVSVIQSITSIQEQTMVFVPKIVTVFFALLVFFSWMMTKILTFTSELFTDIPSLVR